MATPETRFDAFSIHSTFYKRVGTHEIAVNVLIPKDIKPGKHPLFVKWHGGGLVQGEALYPDWFAGWLVPFMLRNGAISVLPNYRLIPEHNGKDIMDDIKDFWRWVEKDLATYIASVSSDIEADFSRILCAGDSAGGLVALQSAILVPEANIKTLLCQYPMTSHLQRLPAADFQGKPSPGPGLIDSHIASITPGTVLSSAVPYARMPLSYALSAYGRWTEFYGTGKDLLPISAIEDAKSLPPTLIIHGEQDTAVSIKDSRAFVEKVGTVLGEDAARNVKLVIVDGDHGFDVEIKEEETPWLREGLEWVEGKWLN